MKNATVRVSLGAASLLALGAAGAGCEMLVQLDRSVVDAGEAGCPICADAAGEAQGPSIDAAADTTLDAAGGDTGHVDGDAPEGSFAAGD